MCDIPLTYDFKQDKLQSLFNVFPIGMMIFEKITIGSTNDFELKYFNETVSKIFSKENANSNQDIKGILKKFKKLTKFSTLTEIYSDMNNTSEESLFKRIFEDLDQTQTEICERYISKDIMIYVKIKIHQEYKLVTIENFNDERLAIQNNIIKNIKTQYLLTLSHELNNPLNSLAHSSNEIISSKLEKIEQKKLINGMKMNINLIKYFIKNFIFSLKMSLDMNSLVKNDKSENNIQKDFINLQYVLKKIQEKTSIFFQTKKIKLEGNFDLLKHVSVSYDYNYFKSMLKNIFMYLFYRLESHGGIYMDLIFEKDLKIVFRKNMTNNSNNFLKILPLNRIDTSFVSEINIESSVITLKILKSIIRKFAKILGMTLKVIEDESQCYLIIMYLKYGIEESLSEPSQSLIEEFTYRNSKKRNTMQLERSISGRVDTVSNCNEYGLITTKSIATNRNDHLFKEPSSNVSRDSWLSNLSLANKLKNQEDTKLESKNYKKDSNFFIPSVNHREFFFGADNKKSNTIKKAEYNLYREKQASKGNYNIVHPKSTLQYTESNIFLKRGDNSNDLVFEKEKQCSNTNSKSNSNHKINNLGTDKIKSKHSNGSLNSNSHKKKINNSSSNSQFSIKSLDSAKKESVLRQSGIKKTTVPSKFKESSNKLVQLKRMSTKLFKNYTKLSYNTINPIQSMSNMTTTATTTSIIKNTDILVVDDDSLNIDVLQTMLKKLKLKSDSCMNGLECLNKLKYQYAKSIKYKLILMDVMMPVMNGIEASSKIEELVKSNKLNSNVKIIIVSAHNNPEIVARATKLSVVVEFLPKPVKQADIQRIINRHYFNKL